MRMTKLLARKVTTAHGPDTLDHGTLGSDYECQSLTVPLFGLSPRSSELRDDRSEATHLQPMDKLEPHLGHPTLPFPSLVGLAPSLWKGWSEIVMHVVTLICCMALSRPYRRPKLPFAGAVPLFRRSRAANSDDTMMMMMMVVV